MSLSNERSAEFCRGRMAGIAHVAAWGWSDRWSWPAPLQSEYDLMEQLLAAAEAREATQPTAEEVIEAAERDREAAESTTAGLRRALEAGKADRWAATVGNTETNAFAPSPWVLMAETALAASPAEHERRIKAEALRATSEELETLRDHIQTEIGPDDARDDIRRVCLNRAKDLREEADRLEAANGR